MNEIIDGERAPSRECNINAVHVKEIRNATGLTQEKFCKLIDVKMGTLRNWEQKKRVPDLTSVAFLTCIAKSPATIYNLLNKK